MGRDDAETLVEFVLRWLAENVGSPATEGANSARGDRAEDAARES